MQFIVCFLFESSNIYFESFYFVLDKVQLKRKRLRTGNDVNLFDISPRDGRKFSFISFSLFIFYHFIFIGDG